jgi:DNA adenine methylase
MKFSSPLRYPGGKASMADLLAQVRRLNNLGDRPIAEPFAGGAGASLTLLYREEAGEILVNDADPSIHDFWWSLVSRSEAFQKKLGGAKVNMKEWRRQRDIYRAKRVSRLNRGFAAFYLNRCNRSGIIMDGGPIGGIDQKGEWKLGARFNRTELLARCRRVAEYGDRVRVSGLDGIDFIESLRGCGMFLFIDPPYFAKGQTLYLNALDHAYHLRLSKVLRSMTKDSWVLTYDDCPEIREMYKGWASIRPFSLRYVASQRRLGREILITPPWMKLPLKQRSVSVTW